jgi:hypothetical protein
MKKSLYRVKRHSIYEGDSATEDEDGNVIGKSHF